MRAFSAQLCYVAIDATEPDDATGARCERLLDPDRVRVFYLATSPDLYGPICRNLGAHRPGHRAVPRRAGKADRPRPAIGARDQRRGRRRCSPKPQIFRIDHYLGKETVQNLLALRFANTIFERLWNADVIDHVQITVAETVGRRAAAAATTTSSGALRDMVQNHMLQLLCLIAMEPPVSLDADRVRDEKLKVLRALRRSSRTRCATLTVRGQYTQGAIDGKPVPGYLADLNGAGDQPTPRPSSR